MERSTLYLVPKGNNASRNIKDFTVAELENAGYAVIVFNPEELNGVNSVDVEVAMIEAGLRTIKALAVKE